MYRLSAAWVAACRCSGRFDPWDAIRQLGGPEGFARASASDLIRHGVPLELASWAESVAPLETRVPFVLAGGEGYPPALRNVPFAPPVLFFHGDIALLSRPMVAIVGARRCTPYGRRIARRLSRAVAAAGGVVVSGLAMGIDSEAHQEALLHGATVAVLGHGLLVKGRIGGIGLRKRIAAGNGVVISEFLPEYPASKYTFPQRNRVIAGLARATVVVEAGHRSGALSTARHALDTGREVLSVPGPLGEGCSEGCLDLIQRGATMVRGEHTVLQAAGLSPQPGSPARLSIPGVEQAVAEALLHGCTIEQLAERADLCVADTLGLLSRLELAGLVRKEPGRRYYLVSL